MIITELSGGLGNQMFQYALGRVIAEKNKDSLLLDPRSFSNIPPGDTQRDYALSVFNLHASVATPAEMRQYFPNRYLQILANLTKISLSKKISIVKEKSHKFDARVFNNTGNIFLSGFWQSEKYFAGFEDLIRQDFKLKNKISKSALNISSKIARINAVSVHVRRGDYANNPNTNKFHGLMTPRYYSRASMVISNSCSRPHFYIFSDDINWTKANIKLGENTHYVSSSNLKDWEEMWLMSICKHHIIANSSFSWWGAWLGETKNSITIAPKNWFKEKSVQTKDIIPNRWKRI